MHFGDRPEIARVILKGLNRVRGGVVARREELGDLETSPSVLLVVIPLRVEHKAIRQHREARATAAAVSTEDPGRELLLLARRATDMA
jgi:hypothetical protein